MNELKMILFDGTELALSGFTLPMHAVMQCEDKADVLAKWEAMNEMNMSKVTILQDGVTVYEFTGGHIDGIQHIMNGDGTLTAHFYMSGVRQEVMDDKTREYVTAAQIMMGEVE